MSITETRLARLELEAGELLESCSGGDRRLVREVP